MRFKRGDTFSYLAKITVNGIVKDLTGWTVTGEMVTQKGKQITTFTCNWVDATKGIFGIRAESADTHQWPLGKISLDIIFTRPDGVQVTSRTKQFEVISRVIP